VSLSPFISRADWWWKILFFYLICREYSHTFSYYNPDWRMSKRDWCRRAPYKCVGLYGLLTSFSVRSLFSFYIYYCPALLAECSCGGGSREPEIQKVPSWMNQDLGSLITTIDSRDCCCLPVAPLVTAILLLTGTFADVGKLFSRLLRADANRY
jgi:hypothetical protein